MKVVYKGLKIGLPKEFFGEGINSEVKEAILAQVNELKEKGAIVEEFKPTYSTYQIHKSLVNPYHIASTGTMQIGTIVFKSYGGLDTIDGKTVETNTFWKIFSILMVIKLNCLL